MRRFSLWLRGKPFVADSMLAAILFVLECLTAPNSQAPGLSVLLGLALCVPIAFRRRHPVVAAAAILGISVLSTVVSSWIGDETLTHPGQLGLAVMLYTLVAYVGRKQAVVYVVGLAADSAFSIWLLHQEPATTVGFISLFYALSWITAEFLGARRLYDEEVAARLAVAEYDRDRRAEEAVAGERTRIARELHDVVAHAVSVMVVQADGASYAVRRNPDAAERALGNIASTGRQALAELRRTVALLRTEQTPTEMPQHGTAGVAKVVGMMRDAGLHVELEMTGELDDIRPALSLGIHRVVQESLTNVLRHAGASPRARVRVRRRDEDVLVEITDNGRGSSQFTQGSGNGLLGMRERVAVLQGNLETGREADGSWRVRAELPLHPED
ncbi:sensor histidine kinase [Rhodococcus sp. NPDC058514]|uniref:sensor histidine kinase n=1 Tax=unclassified Rhodococcus (in: high G+C Gram-positive bacteria) TaxID=192944 RepID=UPI00364D21D7